MHRTSFTGLHMVISLWKSKLDTNQNFFRQNRSDFDLSCEHTQREIFELESGEWQYQEMHDVDAKLMALVLMNMLWLVTVYDDSGNRQGQYAKCLRRW